MSEPSANTEQEVESGTTVATPKHTKLPMAKIKTIMKMDPDASLISNEAIFLVTKATVRRKYSIMLSSTIIFIN